MFNSLFFRVASMVFKFAFLLIAAKYLTPQDVSIFGATNAFVLIMIYFLGLDLYISTSRTIHYETGNFHRLLSNQIIAIGAFFGLYLIAQLIFPNVGSGLPIGLLVLLILFELVSQEFYRLQISHGDYIRANVLFFIKTGFWSVVSSGSIYLGYITSIEQAIVVWIVGAFAACLYGWVSVRTYTRGFSFSPDRARFFADVKNNAFIFSSSVALVVLGNADKVFLGTTGLYKPVAAYVFFGSLAGASMTLIYSGVVNPNYGKLVSSDLTEDIVRAIVRKIGLAVSGLLVAASVAFLLLLDPLLNMIGQPYLADQKGLLVLLMFNVYLNAVGLLPHFYLLARKRDKLIAIASAGGVVGHLLTLYPFYLYFGVPGVAISVACGLATILVLKAAFALKVRTVAWS